MKSICVGVSGTGRNLKNLFRVGPELGFQVSGVFSQAENCPAMQFAREHSLSTFAVAKGQTGAESLLAWLETMRPDLVVLAGYIRMFPFRDGMSYNVVNIHPALLPKHGGKGMYGNRVHQSVLDSGDTESGITIHHVNDRYDDGQIIFQGRVDVKPNDTAEDLAARVHELELRDYPRVIASLLKTARRPR